jgi:fucose permease
MGLDWRMSFMILALTPWLLLAAIGTRFRQSPKDLPETSHIPFSKAEWRSAFYFGALVAGYLSAEVAFGTRMVLWLRTDRAFDPNAANLFMGGFFALFLAGRLLFSMIHIPGWSNWDILRWSSCLSSVLSALGLFFASSFSGFGWPCHGALLSVFNGRDQLTL